jgi:ketosteroid isomerase-like protein
MSEENVALMRRAYEEFNQGNRSLFVELYDPDILLWVSPTLYDSGCHVGTLAVERYFAEMFASFSHSYRVDLEELIPVGDSVIVLATESAQGRRSGAEVRSAEHTTIYTLRVGKIIRIDLHARRAEALAAMGLS